MTRKLLFHKGEKIMLRKFYTTILLLLFTFSFAMAQAGGGRLSGKVIDQQTKEPLIGANISYSHITVPQNCRFAFVLSYWNV